MKSPFKSKDGRERMVDDDHVEEGINEEEKEVDRDCADALIHDKLREDYCRFRSVIFLFRVLFGTGQSLIPKVQVGTEVKAAAQRPHHAAPGIVSSHQ